MADNRLLSVGTDEIQIFVNEVSKGAGKTRPLLTMLDRKTGTKVSTVLTWEQLESLRRDIVDRIHTTLLERALSNQRRVAVKPPSEKRYVVDLKVDG
jgi:hypothetical protein